MEDSKLLSFNKGDIIQIKDIYPNGWCKGDLQGRVGMFPEAKVQFFIGAPENPVVSNPRKAKMIAAREKRIDLIRNR